MDCKGLNWGAAPWWLPSGHAQSIYASVFEPGLTPQACCPSQTWQTPDGDVVLVHRLGEVLDPLATLVLFHGLEGSSQAHYARAFAEECRQPT